MNTNGKRLLYLLAALTAILASAVWIHADNCTPSIFSFVGQSPGELGPSGVHDALAESAVSHPLHVQVFDGNKLVLENNPFAKMVGEVGTQIGRTGVHPLEIGNGFAATVATLHFTANRTLGLGKLAFCLSGESRVVNSLAIGKNRETLQSKIDADNRRDRNWRGCGFPVIDYELAIPLSRPSHNSLLLDLAFWLADIAGSDKTDTAYKHSCSLHNGFAWIKDRKAIPSLPWLKPRKPCLAVFLLDSTKEVAKIQIQSAKSIPFNLERNLSQGKTDRSKNRQVGSLSII